METMYEHNIIHTGAGVELVRRLAAAGQRIFTTAKAREFGPEVGLSEGYIRQALHHLAKSGWVVRLHNGLYAISSSVPGVTPAHEFEIAMALVEPAAISHWSAMHHHGLTEQAPRTVFVLTTAGASTPASKSKSEYRIGDTAYRFIKIRPERFFGTEKIWIGESRVTITDLERTLIDGLTMPEYCGDFSEVLHAFEVAIGKINLERIIDYALNLDAATAKRLGWVLEKQGMEIDCLARLVNVPIKGYRILDPTGPRKGPCNRYWMIQENLPGKVNA
ncbi:MAG: type IV toxin-antitoxin system AbiEi family antitoxin domain-containing protein [Deltaproteobacteria bacterium]|nr:type IV toxin-antitoxin system AbiEi family antitoxin domain-containing protein [Deltaproteobacteria bacterium]